MKCFDLWMANIPAQKNSHVQHGIRPVVIVSNNTVHTHSPVVTVVPLTAKLQKYHLPPHVLLQDQGLERSSLALCEQILSLDKVCMIRRIGYIYKEFDRFAIHHALAIQLGMAA